MPYKYRNSESGHTIEDERCFGSTLYHPTIGIYCPEDHRDPDGNRYPHAHLPHGFPFTRGYLQFYPTFEWVEDEVTAQKSDWAWNAHYGQAYTRHSSSTFTTNCFAFAVGASTAMGFDAWIAFTRSYASVDEVTTVAHTGHAIKVTMSPDWCNPGKHYVSYTVEKNASSGVYSNNNWGVFPIQHFPHRRVRK